MLGRKSLGAIVTALLVTGCGGANNAASPTQTSSSVPATTAIVAKAPVTTAYEAVGAIRAKTASAIQTKATGHITVVHVKEGDTVAAGQTLAELDDRDLLAQTQRAEAGVRQAQQARNEIASSVQAALHAKSAAEANGALALTTYERYKGLVDKRAVSQQAYDEASSRRLEAQAEIARAGDMAASIQARSGEVAARIEQAEAELTAAKTALSYAKVTAPFAGVVTRKLADVGDLAAPGTTLFELEDAGRYRLESPVDEAHAATIHLGDSVAVVVDALGMGSLTGTVAELAPSADTASRTFIVKIDLPDDAKVRSGMFGRALFSGPKLDALTIPATAVQQKGQLTGVYVVTEKGNAQLRLITTGKRYGDTVEALSGLAAGERIVIDHVDQITDGCTVTSTERQ